MANPLLYICKYFGVDWQKIQSLSPYLLALNLIYFFPILIHNTPYIDELDWCVTGSTNHVANGRILGDFLSSILSFNFDFSKNFLIYSGSLNQILSITVLSFAVSIFYLRINNKEPSLYLAILIFIFSANPFLLTLLSYKSFCFNGALPISLALLASLNSQNRLYNIVIGSTLLLIMLNLYQSPLNIFFSATALLFLIEFKNNTKKSFVLLFDNILKFSTAFSIYKLLIIPNIVHKFNDYCNGRRQTVPFDDNFLTQIHDHCWLYINKLQHVFSAPNFLVIFSIISIVAFGIKYIFIDNNKKVSSFFVYILCSSALFFNIFGLLIFLKSPTVEPRLLIGFSVFLLYLYFAFDQSIAKWFPSLKILVFIPLMYFTFISFSFNAMTTSQYQYNYSVAKSVMDKLEDLGFNQQNELFTHGSLGYAPSVKNSTNKNPLLSFLFPDEYFIGNAWYVDWFFKYLGFKARYRYIKPEILMPLCKSRPVYASQSYKIIHNENLFIVAFKGQCYNLSE